MCKSGTELAEADEARAAVGTGCGALAAPEFDWLLTRPTLLALPNSYGGAVPIPAQPLRLDNPVQHYDWGSPTAIPQLLGAPTDGRPHAELWLGGHPSAPSLALVDGQSVPLNELIRADPNATLGERVADEFGPRLPFLLKVLAATRALSLQVHPKPHAAREGFNRENAAGLALDDPQRTFRDDQHKPEMVVAISQFEVLAGFRSPRAILAILADLPGELLGRVRDQLTESRSAESIRIAFQTLLSARGEAHWRSDIDRTVAAVADRLAAGSPYSRADATVLQLATEFPGDPGAIASLMLNRATLEPSDGLFLPAAEVHAYLFGVGIEVMASSDNVIRAGLTSKRVDEQALVHYASFAPQPPALPQVQPAGERGNVLTYRVPAPEFALTAVDLDSSEVADLPGEGPRILLCLEGQVELLYETGSMKLSQGQSVFVPHAVGRLRASGSGHLVCAWVP